MIPSSSHVDLPSEGIVLQIESSLEDCAGLAAWMGVVHYISTIRLPQEKCLNLAASLRLGIKNAARKRHSGAFNSGAVALAKMSPRCCRQRWGRLQPRHVRHWTEMVAD